MITGAGGYGYECVNDELAPFFLMHRNRRIEYIISNKNNKRTSTKDEDEIFIIAKNAHY